MKRSIGLVNVIFLALLLLVGSSAALAAVEVTIESAIVTPGQTGFTVDVTVNDQAPAIRGVEINIGYDSGTLTFQGGVAFDGNWLIDQIGLVAPDATNTQSGQIKILLAAISTGIPANTSATLARLTFDINATPIRPSYPLIHLPSSPGLKDTSMADIAYSATNGAVQVTGVTVTVNLTPPTVDNVVAGEAVPLTAEVLVNGEPYNLTDPGDVAFSTSGEGTFGTKAIVGGNVVVDYITALLIETATITATETLTGENNQDTSTITSIAGPLAAIAVSPPNALALIAGDTQGFTAAGADANGNTVTEAGTITWSVEGDIGSIGSGTGSFLATTVGSGLVRATSDLGVSGTSGTITVSAGALANLAISPPGARALTAGDTQQFGVSGTDAYGNDADLGVITWSVTGGIGNVSQTGLFEATTVGGGAVIATSSFGPTASSGDVTVSAGALANLTMDPPGPLGLTADDTQQFDVSGTDAYGNVADLGVITWSVTGGIGTISPTGLFEATTVGTGTVTATSSIGGVSVTSGTITVTPGAAASILLAPDGIKVASGGKGPAELTATVFDAKGNIKTDLSPTTITFSVSGDGIDNAGWTTNTDETENGVAEVLFTTQGEVPEPGTTTVNVEATNNGITSNSIVITIVNFSATADYEALVTAGEPKQATLNAVGADDYTWSIVSGPGTLSATAGEEVTFTAPDTITDPAGEETVIRVSDAGDLTVFFELTITTYEPVRFTAPAAPIGITHDGNVTTYQLEFAGGDGDYSFAVNGEPGVITVDENGLVTGVAPGIRTVYLWDSNGDVGTNNNFRAETLDIEVVDGIVVDPEEVALLAKETRQFAAAGGKGGGVAANYTWLVNNVGAGSINANGLFTAANVTTPQTAIITATDKTYTNIKGTAIVDVYPTLTIELPAGYDPENPATWPLVQPGGTYDFEAFGGGESYIWTVDGPVWVEGGEGESFTFEAPTEGPFAGVYTVTVTDGVTGKSFSINVKVPMTITPANLAMLGLGDPDWYYIFEVAGAPEGTGIEVSLVSTGRAPIANPDEYGLIESDEVFDEEAIAEVDFSPAEITGAFKSFLFKIQAVEGGNAVPLEVNGGTPLKDAGLDVLYSGVMRIFPVVEYEGYVVDENDNPLDGVEVRVLLGSEVVFEGDTDAEGYFRFLLADPASIGQQYLVGFVTDGFVAQVVSTEGWVNPKTIVLVEAIPGQSISGFVEDTDAFPIAGALVETTVGGQALSTFTADNGSYVLNFSVEGTWNYEVSNSQVIEGECDPIEEGAGTLTIQRSGAAYIMKVTTPEEVIEFSGTFDEGVYTFMIEEGAETTTLEFSLQAPNHAVGIVQRTEGSCVALADIELTRELGEGGTLLARASKLGYLAKEQDILDDPIFVLTPLAPAPEQEICEAGGAFEWEGAVVEIPAGALDGCYTVEVNANIPVIPADDNIRFTQKSVVLVEISIAGAPMPLAKPIVVTIPFDRDEVEPGDFRAGRAVVYHAATADDLRAGIGIKVVPVSDILVEDHFNGLVTFRVSSLSVFGVGGAQPTPDPGPGPPPVFGGGSSGGCFISTMADGPVYPAWIASLFLLIFASAAWIVRRAAK